MVDERGRDKNQICSGGRRAENEIRDNYQFILSVRASHFRPVSKTISIPKDLGHWHDWRTCRSRCGGLLILTDSSQRSFSRFWSLFLEHSEDGPDILLNRGLIRIPITLTGNCFRNFLNMCLQHLIEAQLVLRSYYEVVHLGIDVLQELAVA
jgi:hypothetical protein